MAIFWFAADVLCETIESGLAENSRQRRACRLQLQENEVADTAEPQPYSDFFSSRSRSRWSCGRSLGVKLPILNSEILSRIGSIDE